MLNFTYWLYDVRWHQPLWQSCIHNCLRNSLRWFYFAFFSLTTRSKKFNVYIQIYPSLAAADRCVTKKLLSSVYLSYATTHYHSLPLSLWMPMAARCICRKKNTSKKWTINNSNGLTLHEKNKPKLSSKEKEYKYKLWAHRRARVHCKHTFTFTLNWNKIEHCDYSNRLIDCSIEP